VLPLVLKNDPRMMPPLSLSLSLFLLFKRFPEGKSGGKKTDFLHLKTPL
jgi:hypothetical protein